MARRRQLYEGKAKVLFEGPEPGTLVQYFKDDAIAGGGTKRGIITGKGVLNNRISEYLMMKLADIGVPTHFVRRLNMREQLIREVEIIPLEVVVRNVAAGSLSTRLGIPEGTRLPRSIIEYNYKNDQLNRPMVAEEHITAFGKGAPTGLDDGVPQRLGILLDTAARQVVGPQDALRDRDHPPGVVDDDGLGARRALVDGQHVGHGRAVPACWSRTASIEC